MTEEYALLISAEEDGWTIKFDPARLIGRSTIVLPYAPNREAAQAELTGSMTRWAEDQQLTMRAARAAGDHRYDDFIRPPLDDPDGGRRGD